MEQSHLDKLLRGSGRELDAYLTLFAGPELATGTRVSVRCYHIALDGSGRVRAADLAQVITAHIVDFALPRSEILQANASDARHNTTANAARLRSKAKSLFTRLKKTGEGGELLLYMLAQSALRLPQLFCKMPHKTSGRMHVHGIDGIHAGVDQASGDLVLYWGEAKLYSSLGTALTACFGSLKPFLCGEGGSQDGRRRDIDLIRDNIDLADQALQDAVLRYLDPGDTSHNRLGCRGVCLVGFDSKKYPTAGKSNAADLSQELKGSFAEWRAKLAASVIACAPLESVEVECFLIPFPSVAEFRKAFLAELANG